MPRTLKQWQDRARAGGIVPKMRHDIEYKPKICGHEWLQDHEEFIPHPFYHLIRCLQCNRIIIDKSNPKVQSSSRTETK